MEPLVTLHWVDVSQCFPTDDLQWCRCAIQVPPCGHETSFVAPMRLRLALAMFQGEEPPSLADPALDVLSTLTSRYGVLYTCLLTLPVFRDSPAVVYSVYRKEETPFACKDGPALLDRLVTELLAYEDAMEHRAADVRARLRAFDDAMRTVETEGAFFVENRARQSRKAAGATRAQRTYARLRRDIHVTREVNDAQVEHIIRQFGVACRQELTRALHEAFGLYGPKNRNFHGLPAFYAIAATPPRLRAQSQPIAGCSSADGEATAPSVLRPPSPAHVTRSRPPYSLIAPTAFDLLTAPCPPRPASQQVSDRDIRKRTYCAFLSITIFFTNTYVTSIIRSFDLTCSPEDL